MGVLQAWYILKKTYLIYLKTDGVLGAYRPFVFNY